MVNILSYTYLKFWIYTHTMDKNMNYDVVVATIVELVTQRV